jgi:shikimate dehydrogenase
LSERSEPPGGWPSGATLVAGVIGSPVRHSLSPVIHNAAFAAEGLNWVFLAFEVDGEAVPVALAGAAALGLRGLSVTMPLKERVAVAVDRLTPAAAELGAVNTVLFGPDGATGANTDGEGFLDALRPWDPAGRRCAVIGAGGAARAVIRALAEAGAADVAVLNRSPDRAARAAALGAPVARVGRSDEVRGAELVVNATPLGMDATPGAGRLPLDEELLGPGQVVVDLVYHPVRTPLLVTAERRGARAVDGVGMLVHQAGHAFRAWTGGDPPLAVMEAAARRALGG